MGCSGAHNGVPGLPGSEAWRCGQPDTVIKSAAFREMDNVAFDFLCEALAFHVRELMGPTGYTFTVSLAEE